MKKLLALMAGIVFTWSTPAAAKMLVAVSIAPQAYFLKQIAGDRVEALVMVPPGADAHTYEPKPRQLAELGKAAVYFGIGMDFENAWLPRFQAANPKMAVVRTDAGIEKIPMVAHEDDDDDHGQDKGKGKEEGHHHEAGEPDPHVWLSPKLAKTLAASMRDALAKADPEGAADYAAGYEKFAASCDALAADIQQRFADLPPGEHKFMVFHPSWGYFARDFGLTQEPIEQLGREPGPKALAALVREAKKDGVKVIFVQPQMSARQAQTIAQAIGGQVAALDPLSDDWAANLENAAKALRQGMAGQTEPK
ncbi:zinc ABC transporter substrate-binding protein [Solidesulfovibrio sp.]|uniref:metal ABC transporter solute-binding protein, Zn/Mn family n=1 Tax=Solidesulfovibrio sp. TaxID=2910990 RepID=UPI00261DCFA3|nr:zinc ABC transporter substrate-binding protein [Solidesulfovibrio sp.]